MKTWMKFARVEIALLWIVLAGAGCGRMTSSEGGGHDTGGEGDPSWQFLEGRGVKLSGPAMAIAGIQMADVSVGEPEEAETYLVASGRVLSGGGEHGTSRVNLTMSAERAAGVGPGSIVQVDDESGLAGITGRVERVDRQAEGATGKVEMIGSLDDPEQTLRPGSFITARIEQSGTDGGDALRIPASALLTTARGTFVYVINGEHYFRSPVVVGPKTGRSVEILDGLFEGDVVVKAGVNDLWLIELQAVNGGESCADSH